ncbi:MAG: hypothetical protein ABI637_03215 [Gemmatimonadota bacterium]
MRTRLEASGAARIACTLLGVLSTACGGAGGTRGVAPVRPVMVPRDACASPALEGAPRDTVVVGITEPVDPRHAPAGTNDGERVVFAQFYETLVRVGCAGDVVPGAAAAWRNDSGTAWTFVLASSAMAVTVGRNPGSASARLSNIRGTGDSLRITLSGYEPNAPAWLADRRLALIGASGTASWPVATGAFGPVIRGGALFGLPANGGRPVLSFVIRPAADGRDLLDAGADLVISRSPSVIAYAEHRAEVVTIPLAWDRTYALLTRAGGAADGDSLPLAARDAMARDLVGPNARGARGPFWWDDGRGCTTSATPRSAVGRRVVYPRGDAVAQALAERVVALAAAPNPPAWAASLRGAAPLTTLAVDGPGLAHTLGNGIAAAVILRLPAMAPASNCLDELAWRRDDLLTPLVDTRALAIIRRGAVRISSDADGSIRIMRGDTQ